jgi:hypothetical protein
MIEVDEKMLPTIQPKIPRSAAINVVIVGGATTIRDIENVLADGAETFSSTYVFNY